MPRGSHKYRHHRSSGRAFVVIEGKRKYLGAFGSEASLRAYKHAIAELSTTREAEAIRTAPEFVGHRLSIAELIERYREHVESYYKKDGKPTSHILVVRSVMRDLRKHSGSLPATQFGPLALEDLRDRMVKDGQRSRVVINRYVHILRQMFRWAVRKELIPVQTYEALRTLDALRRGRTEAREAPPIQPVPPEEVEATLPHLSPQVAAMIRLQLLAGMRPQEVCDIRPVDITLADGVMVYRPASHKTEHHGRERRIFLGPKAQEVLRPWLDRDADAYCFSPREAVEEWQADKRRRRQSKVQPSQVCRAKQHPKRKPQERYTSASYRRAIARGCAKRAKAEGIKVDTWAPNRLRHNRATELRAAFGIEAAQTVLGHSDQKTTLVYAERDFARAAEIMRQIG